MALESSTMAADSTVRSQDSSNSSDSKETKISKVSTATTTSSNSGSEVSKVAESCAESKHSKDALIVDSEQQQQQPRSSSRNQKTHRSSAEARQLQPQLQQQPQQPPPTTTQQHQLMQQQQQQQQQIATKQQQQQQSINKNSSEPKNDSNLLMFTSCGQLLLGVILVVFGVLVLVHGASLGQTGAGLWAGAGALCAGGLGVVAALSTSSSTGKPSSGFASAHLASSLVALALSNLAAITALTAVVRDSQRNVPDVALLQLPDDEGVEVEAGWSGLLASCGLLVASCAELFVSGYVSLTLAPKLCSCLRPASDDADQADDLEACVVAVDGQGKNLKTRNMVHQWVIAQSPGKNQPIYVVQPMPMPMHPMMQAPYGLAAGKYHGGFVAAGAYGHLPAMLPAYHHLQAGPPPAAPSSIAGQHRPPSQIARSKYQAAVAAGQKKRRHSSDQSDGELSSGGRHHHHHHYRRGTPSSGGSPDTPKNSHHQKSSSKSASPSKEPPQQLDMTCTYTGLDKRISEEFISIAMDPERKSNRASSHHGSDIEAARKTATAAS